MARPLDSSSASEEIEHSTTHEYIGPAKGVIQGESPMAGSVEQALSLTRPGQKFLLPADIL
jgi:hypothetical protein